MLVAMYTNLKMSWRRQSNSMRMWGDDAGIASHDVIGITQQQQQQQLLDDTRRYGLTHNGLARASLAARDGACVAWLGTGYFGTYLCWKWRQIGRVKDSWERVSYLRRLLFKSRRSYFQTLYFNYCGQLCCVRCTKYKSESGFIRRNKNANYFSLSRKSFHTANTKRSNSKTGSNNKRLIIIMSEHHRQVCFQHRVSNDLSENGSFLYCG